MPETYQPDDIVSITVVGARVQRQSARWLDCLLGAYRLNVPLDGPGVTVERETAEVTIRWRRYGLTGGRWRAEFPPGNGVESGYVESSSLETVERVATIVAERYGYRIVRDLSGGAS